MNVEKNSENFDRNADGKPVPIKKSIEDIFGKKPPRNDNLEEFSLKNKIAISILAALIFFGLILTGVWFYMGNQKEQKTQEKISIFSETQNLPEKNNEPNTNLAEEERNDVSQKENNILVEAKISVLNGGAPSGSAGGIAAILGEKGYKKVKAENASADNHLGSAIYYSGSFSELASILAGILKDKYHGIEIKEAETNEQKSADVVIMLGK